MDGVRFDALAKTLSGAAGRRGLLTGLLGGTLASLLGGLATEARPKKKRRGTRRKDGQDQRDRKDHGDHQDRQPAPGRPAGTVSAEKKRKKKKTVCHEGRTIKVPKKAVKGHLAHGDTLGACPLTCTPESCPLPPECSEQNFRTCRDALVDDFPARVEPCRSQCDDPDAPSCQSCLNLVVDEMLPDTEACLAQTCPPALGAAGPRATKRMEQRVAAGGRGTVHAERRQCTDLPCCYLDTVDCVHEAVEAYYKCMGGAGISCFIDGPLCIAIAAYCVGQYVYDTSECREEHGCVNGRGCFEGDACCPDGTSVACHGACCSADTCQSCIDGACTDCLPPQVCIPGGRGCVCPNFTRACGGTPERPADCCDAGEDCCAGVCCDVGEHCCGGECCSNGHACCGLTTCCNPPNTECINGECKAPCDQCQPRDRASGTCTPTDDIYCEINRGTPNPRDGFCCEDECLDYFQEFGARGNDEHCGGCGIACGAGSCCVTTCVEGQPCYGCNEWRGGLTGGHVPEPTCGPCTFDNGQWSCPTDRVSPSLYSCTGKPCTPNSGVTHCCPSQYADGKRGVCTDLDGCCPEDRVVTILAGPEAGMTFCRRPS